MEKAKDYAKLVRIKGNHVDVCKVRLFDGHRYNWHSLICSNGKLYCPTDQTYDLNANCTEDITFWDEVWLNSVRVYKKPWWKKVFNK